jgi:hypothetical protein
MKVFMIKTVSHEGMAYENTKVYHVNKEIASYWISKGWAKENQEAKATKAKSEKKVLETAEEKFNRETKEDKTPIKKK